MVIYPYNAMHACMIAEYNTCSLKKPVFLSYCHTLLSGCLCQAAGLVRQTETTSLPIFKGKRIKLVKHFLLLIIYTETYGIPAKDIYDFFWIQAKLVDESVL